MGETSKLCAFSNGAKGGHPAAAVTVSEFGTEAELLAQAKRIGYDETAVAYPQAGSNSTRWRVRFFSHDMELQSGGASLLVLGAILGLRHGAGEYRLQTNQADLLANIAAVDGRWQTSISYPSTSSRVMPSTTAADLLRVLGYTQADLAANYTPRVGIAGASHAVFSMKDEATLNRAMTYNIDQLKAMLKQGDLQSAVLYAVGADEHYHVRAAFPFSGVREDGASGSGVAAMGAVLRDIGGITYGDTDKVWYRIVQGDQIGSPSTVDLEFFSGRTKPIKVWGTVRDIVAGQRDPRQDNIQPPEQAAPVNNAEQGQNDQNQNQANEQQPAPRGAGNAPLDAGNLPPPRAAD